MRGCPSAAALPARPLHLSRVPACPRRPPSPGGKGRRDTAGPELRLPRRPRARRCERGAGDALRDPAAAAATAGSSFPPAPSRRGWAVGGAAKVPPVPERGSAALAVCGEGD